MKHALYSATLIVAAVFVVALGVRADTWLSTGGEHFQVFQMTENTGQARKILDDAEGDLERILNKVAYQKPKQAWKDKNRIKIFLFDNQEAYQEVRGAPQWAAGDVEYETKTINGYVGSDDFVHQTLPHEIAHMVLFDLTIHHENVPRWLHEGFAMANEDQKREGLEDVLKKKQFKVENYFLSFSSRS